MDQNDSQNALWVTMAALLIDAWNTELIKALYRISHTHTPKRFATELEKMKWEKKELESQMANTHAEPSKSCITSIGKSMKWCLQPWIRLLFPLPFYQLNHTQRNCLRWLGMQQHLSIGPKAITDWLSSVMVLRISLPIKSLRTDAAWTPARLQMLSLSSHKHHLVTFVDGLGFLELCWQDPYNCQGNIL